MVDASPWDDISIPRVDLHVRQVAWTGVVPCFWGRDTSGACLFIVELTGDLSDQFRKSTVMVKGIDIDLRAGDQGQQRLILALEKQVDRDLFHGLCRTLASSLAHATNSASALAVSLAHVRRWKAFLAGSGQHLSAQDVRGLFAEILFLNELLDNGMAINDAVDAWLGPERSHQDFIFGNTAVEIKSLSGAERSTVRISSEDQLESLNDALFLRIYRLSSLKDAAGALSLNDIVSVVQSRLADAIAIEAFEKRLVICGYAPLPEYDLPRFVVSDLHTFRVEREFPRLRRSELPSGLQNVAYDIRLEAIAPFECDGESVFGER